MARLSIGHNQDHTKQRIEGFYNDFNREARHAFSPPPKKRMGLPRIFSTAIALTLGGLLCYVSIHYLQAYNKTEKIVGVRHLSQNLSPIPKRDDFFLKPYLDAFRINRTYLQSGQALQAEYSIPEGSKLKLKIKRCSESLIIEVFECEVIGTRNIIIENETKGAKLFKFQGKGFYLFEEVLIPQEGFAPALGQHKVIWRRV